MLHGKAYMKLTRRPNRLQVGVSDRAHGSPNDPHTGVEAVKKILLSLAVIASSGAYVAYANPFGAKLETDASASASTSSPAIKPASSVLPPAARAAATADLPRQRLPATVAPAASATIAAVTVPTTFAPTPAFSTLQVPPIPPAAVQVAQPADQQMANPATGPAAPTAVVVPLPSPRPANAPAAVTVAQTSAAAPTAYRDGTFKGTSANAYYGRVQVSAVIQGGQLVSVKVLSYPNDRRTSRNINSFALPRLEQEAIQAQSANIDGVSGATLTSGAYEQSLDAALSAARTRGNNA
jgi:uncharacterized protein with FMN-binding domain